MFVEIKIYADRSKFRRKWLFLERERVLLRFTKEEEVVNVIFI